MNARALTDTAIKSNADRLAARSKKAALRAVRAELGDGSLVPLQLAIAREARLLTEVEAAELHGPSLTINVHRDTETPRVVR